MHVNTADTAVDVVSWLCRSPSNTVCLMHVCVLRTRQCNVDEGDSMVDAVGTSYIMAPEVIATDYTEKSDLWSLGVCAFMMLTGEASVVD